MIICCINETHLSHNHIPSAVFNLHTENVLRLLTHELSPKCLASAVCLLNYMTGITFPTECAGMLGMLRAIPP